MNAPRTAGRAAEPLVLGGMIIQLVQVIGFVGFAATFVRGQALTPVLLVLAAIGSFWMGLVFLLSYLPLRNGDITRARVPTFVFGLLSILTASVVAGLFYILAYDRIALAERVAKSPIPPTPAKTSSKVCIACGRANPLSQWSCQACGFLLGS